MAKANFPSQHHMAEGTITDRALERADLEKRAVAIIAQMPTGEPDRTVFIRNLTSKALRKEVEYDVFELVVKRTGSFQDVQAMLPRQQALNNRRRDRQ